MLRSGNLIDSWKPNVTRDKVLSGLYPPTQTTALVKLCRFVTQPVATTLVPKTTPHHTQNKQQQLITHTHTMQVRSTTQALLIMWTCSFWKCHTYTLMDKGSWFLHGSSVGLHVRVPIALIMVLVAMVAIMQAQIKIMRSPAWYLQSVNTCSDFALYAHTTCMCTCTCIYTH